MREFFERLIKGLHGRHEADPQVGEVGLIFDFEHETDSENRFACSRRTVYDGHALSLGSTVHNVLMFLLKTLVNRLNRFVLIWRERFERREFEQVGILELFDGVNRIVFFAKFRP